MQIHHTVTKLVEINLPSSTHRKGPRIAAAQQFERALLGRIKAMSRPADFISGEVFRALRSYIKQHRTLEGLPQDMAEEVAIFFPFAVPEEVQASVEQDTHNLMPRQIVWLQAAELLIAGGIPWSCLEPTPAERDAMVNHKWTEKLHTGCALVLKEWERINATLAQMQLVDIEYLKPPTTPPPTLPQHEQQELAVIREIERVLIQRVAKRFDGWYRHLSLDTGVAYLLQIKRPSAIYLRKAVEYRLQRKFHLPNAFGLTATASRTVGRIAI